MTNEITQWDGEVVSHDPDGNVTYIDRDSDLSMGYDALGRLVRVEEAGVVTEYRYNSFGNRVAEIRAGVETRYLVDPFGGGNVMASYDSSGLNKQYLLGSSIIAQLSDGASSEYLEMDAIGSVVGLSDGIGNASAQFAYDPFGRLMTSTGTALSDYLFVGGLGVATESASLQFMRHRYYLPDLGRFSSLDPVMQLGGNNYAYADNAPTVLVDPLGLQSCPATPTPTPVSPLSPTPSSTSTPINAEVAEQPGEVTGAFLTSPLGGMLSLNREASETSLGLNLSNGMCGGQTTPWPWNGGYTSPTPRTPQNGGPTWPIEVTFSRDPNQKVGPTGVGPQNFVAGDSMLSYRIDFENDATATAPAQRVTVTDTLANTLDLNSLQFTGVGFGDLFLPIPVEDSQYFQTTVGYTVDGKSMRVTVELGIRLHTREIFATFQSLDTNFELPPDVQTGFLPPEDGSGRGMGYFTYDVQAMPGLATGTSIRNVATITFDEGERIDTNQIDPHDPTKGTDPNKEALVTLDAESPNSRVSELSADNRPVFEVQWSGSDGSGAGIALYDIYVSVDDGERQLWLESTTVTHSKFYGLFGHRYAFTSVAQDTVGNLETFPVQPDAVTTVNIFPWQNMWNPTDTNDDSHVSPIDALLVINELNTRGSHILPPGQDPDALLPYFDVSADGYVSPIDALIIINEINNQVLGEGELAHSGAVGDVDRRDAQLEMDSRLDLPMARRDAYEVADCLFGDLDWLEEMVDKRRRRRG
ncbi:MAG: hypothetical protein IT423_18315 [Pirellulaceae bacterium]|nr:hypothetical protein [Pirellulaceae bacterium]